MADSKIVDMASSPGMFDDAFSRNPVLAMIATGRGMASLDYKDEQMRLIAKQAKEREAKQRQAEIGTLYNFYPNQDYIKRGLAPERYGENDLRALAQAEKEAVAKGVMTPEVAKYFLPNVLTEGAERAGNYGLSFPYYSPKGGDPYAALAKKMGLEPEISGAEGRPYAYRMATDPSTKLPMIKEMRVVPPNTPFYEPKNAFDAAGRFNYAKSYTPEERLYNAKLAAMILGSKGKVPQEAITAWNGIGEGAANHWKKVQALKDALQLPQNAALMKKYQELLQSK